MTTTVRSVTVELTADEARYVLHALSEFKAACHQKIETDEEGDGELTHMYANDVMQAKLIYEKIEKIAVPVFGKKSLEFSYELL
jgi:hypothetical protein